MSKVAYYLQEHLVGEVMTSTDARRYFANDASILQQAPALITYPKNENDVRKTTRFTWQLAERGRVIPVTARGSGTDQYGAALGSGIMTVFPAHMNRIIELDTKDHTVTVEPGMNFGRLQQTLKTHGRFLPPYPSSLEYSTIGGAVANNSSGEKSLKYGDMRNFVKSLRVVLANGEVIETGRISKRELNKKLGLATFEGEIYRSIDTLIEENKDFLDDSNRDVAKNNCGYELASIKNKDGSFDLTPLFIGSQGTLGVITEIELTTEPYNPFSTLLVASFDSLEQMQNAVLDLLDLKERPSSMEFIDGNLLSQVKQLNPNYLKDIISEPFPSFVLFLEYDEADKHHKKNIKNAAKILENFARDFQESSDAEEQDQLWTLRHSTATVIGHNESQRRALPVIDDGAVPITRLRDYIEGTYKILEECGLDTPVWGHAGTATIHVMPKLNLAQVGDRQKIFKLMVENAKLIISLGGTISSEAGDGRLKAPFLEHQLGSETYNLHYKVKQIMDPYETLNPGVKFGTDIEALKKILRADYTMHHLYTHLARN